MGAVRLAACTILLGALARAPGAVGEPAARQLTAGWQLAWADEFDRDGLPDPANWSYDVGGHGWGNNELQFYTKGRAENARVERGHLVIEARRESWEGRDYTSARLVTKGKRDWVYGRVEVRARLPKGRGSWPAIWMLGSTTPLEWPDDGEIDIMEHVGFDPGVIHASVHTKRYNHVAGTQRTARIPIPDAQDAFHDYSVEWDRDRIRAFVDGRAYFEFTREGDDKDRWPFAAPHHLLLNVAVGGNWGGQKGVDPASLPYRFEIDYVRVSRREP
jgi:beta-glucanase (GH16 family)